MSSVGRFAAIVLSLTSACAAPAYVAHERIVPVMPAGVKHAESHFDAADGTHLFAQSWAPEGDAKAVVVIVHGLKDHSSRYEWAAEKLVARGYAIEAFDLRGHGNSEGDRVWVKSFDEYLGDLDVFLARVAKEHPGKPVFLFGHSMGGAIVTLYTITKHPQLQGLALSGAALKPGADVSGFLIGVAGVLSTVTPTLAVMDLDLKQFSRDPAMVKDNAEDPLVYQGNGPARTAGELLKALEKIGEHMEDVVVPVLAMHGGADRVTNPEGSKELVQRAKSADKTLKIYDGLYHDILHEPEMEQVFQDLAGWLDAHVPTTPAPAP